MWGRLRNPFLPASRNSQAYKFSAQFFLQSVNWQPIISSHIRHFLKKSVKIRGDIVTSFQLQYTLNMHAQSLSIP